jgi:hypothetical protein
MTTPRIDEARFAAIDHHRLPSLAIGTHRDPPWLAGGAPVQPAVGRGSRAHPLAAGHEVPVLRPSGPPLCDRIAAVIEELVKFTLPTRDLAHDLVERHLGRKEMAAARTKRTTLSFAT